MKHVKLYEDFLNESNQLALNEGAATIQSVQQKQKQNADKATKDLENFINSIAKKYPKNKPASNESDLETIYRGQILTKKLQELQQIVRTPELEDWGVPNNGYLNVGYNAGRTAVAQQLRKDTLQLITDPALANDVSDYFNDQDHRIFDEPTFTIADTENSPFNWLIQFSWYHTRHDLRASVGFQEVLMNFDGIDGLINAAKDLKKILASALLEWAKYTALLGFDKWMEKSPERQRIKAIESKYPLNPMPQNWSSSGQVVKDAKAYSYEDLLVIINARFRGDKSNWVKKGGPSISFSKNSILWFYEYDKDLGEWVGGYENQKRAESNQAPMNLMQFVELLSKEV
jgi:hypothetical protein